MARVAPSSMKANPATIAHATMASTGSHDRSVSSSRGS